MGENLNFKILLQIVLLMCCTGPVPILQLHLCDDIPPLDSEDTQ